MDGVDCAILRSDGHETKTAGKPVHISYNSNLQSDISRAMEEASYLGSPTNDNAHITQVEKTLTTIHGEAVRDLLAINNRTAPEIDVIGFHGQTLIHRPDMGWSWQIGNGQELATLTKIPVINDFRRQDVKNGGQGAPLVPIYHQALLKMDKTQNYPIAIINIGGVSNITWVGSNTEGNMLAFDTGPGNAFSDDWVRQHTGAPMDQDGEIAATGVIDLALIDEWMKNGYFYKTPPKSLDRNAFDIREVQSFSLENGTATLLEFTARSIEMALNHCPVKPKYIYICGGGRHNKTLMVRLKNNDIPLAPVEKIGWNGDFLEAEAFAFLACRHLMNLPITYPGTTGVSQPFPGGKLYHPE